MTVDISGYSRTAQIILTALKKYGMIIADNVMNFALCGTSDYRFSDEELSDIKSVLSNNLEVVDMGSEWEPGYIHSDS